MKSSRDKKAKIVVTILSIMAGVLLLSEFFFYVCQGRSGQAASFGLHLSNLILFILCDLFLVGILTDFGVVLFGGFSIKKGQPCRRRSIFIILLSIAGMGLVIISQFTGLYYTIDETNTYHRGDLFPLSVAIPIIGMMLLLSILLQYRKNTTRGRFLVLLSFIILPVAGFVVQYFLYGFAYMDIGIALAVNIIFIENIIYQNQQIRIAERTDIRTGLANEHSCIEWIRARKAKKEILDYAAIYFDISRFSSINRKYGAKTGNRVLAIFAESFSKELAPDEFLGHQRGDQFIVIVHKKNIDTILKKLSDLRVEFTDDTGKECDVHLSVKAGIYEIENAEVSSEDVINYAATALDHASHMASDHSVVYMTKDLMDTIEEKIRFEKKIRKALEKGEFHPYYQPKVNSRTGKLCGAEALARWKHKGELIRPGEFIQVMERNESICDLDMYMLRAVCRDISKWMEEGLEVPPVSINFSRRNLADPDLAKNIDQVVTESGIPKNLIEIEITETVDEFPLSVMKTFVDELHKRGFSSSIDDFGSANSSMAVLREISFDTVKIDKGFIDHDQNKDLTILDHIIKMALSIGLRIVAEGVEQEAQVKKLQSFGAEVIQGYYYDRPMPEEKMRERLKDPHYDK
jgi:diguanylate cyclase (GGDEF)-like protein